MEVNLLSLYNGSIDDGVKQEYKRITTSETDSNELQAMPHRMQITFAVVKGLCHGDFTFLGEKCAEVKINNFSCTRNTPTTSRGGNRMIFSKVEQTIVSGDFSTKQRRNLTSA